MSFMNFNLFDNNFTIMKCILKDKYKIKIIIDNDSDNYELINFIIAYTRRNSVGWVGFWDRKHNPLKVWVGRVGLELGLGWVGFFLGLLMVANEKINDFF